ncbi:MAG: hypothetical protein H8E40_00025 [Chloroflexi bacterium]|nr:hypothetical protein [Chloroflexota bacterium]
MFGKRYHKWLGALAVIVLLAGVVAAGSAAWPIESGGGTQEGIKVHGHWTIEVSDPDGTLVERREFDNAFVDSGILARLLARQRTVAFWRIKLIPDTPLEYYAVDILEATDGAQGTYVFKTLTVESINTGGNAGTIILSGTATAPHDDKITMVYTNLCTVLSHNAPSAPQFTGVLYESGFTESALSPGVDVTEGQQVAVTVVISFS